MRLAGRAVRLSIFVGEGDLWHHKPLYAEIVHRARKIGLAGATVVRGLEGFGASSRIHAPHLFRLSEDMPLLIVIVDAEQRIEEFLPKLDELDISGLVFRDEVEVIRYLAGQRPKRRWLRRGARSERSGEADHTRRRARGSLGSVADGGGGAHRADPGTTAARCRRSLPNPDDGPGDRG